MKFYCDNLSLYLLFLFLPSRWNFYKNIKNTFYFTKKADFVLEIINFLYSPLCLFFPSLVAADFIEEVVDEKFLSLWHHHVSTLDFKNLDSLISGEVKF